MNPFLGKAFTSFVEAVEKFCPGASVEFDNDGQIVIYTSLTTKEAEALGHRVEIIVDFEAS